MDQVRRKYGSHSIGFASVINNDLGIEFKGDGDGPQEEKIYEAAVTVCAMSRLALFHL